MELHVADGKIGFGTDAPTAELEIKSTGDVAQLLLDRASGAQAQFTAKENVVNIGSRTNHPVKFFVNQAPVLTRVLQELEKEIKK